MDINNIVEIKNILESMETPAITSLIEKQIDELTAELIELVGSINECRDGFTFDEIMEVITDSIDVIAKSRFIINLDNQDERIVAAIAILKEVYFDPELLDNPDIPMIPNWIEGKIENLLFDLLLPGIIRGILKKYSK